MNREQKELLKRMEKENNTVDNTDKIRRLKHSEKIRQDVLTMQKMKGCVKAEEIPKMEEWFKQNCSFLYENYRYIFNRLLSNELNPQLLFTFLDCLKRVEDGELQQQEASFEIGKILKQLYVDPKIENDKKEYNVGKNISWNEFKNNKV